MPRQAVRHAACAALVAALAVSAAAGHAATVVQTADFDQVHDYTIHQTVFDVTDTAVTPLHFDAFDTALGTLTDVQWSFRSTQDYGTGVSVVGADAADVLQNSTVITTVALNGGKLDPGSFVSAGGVVYCSSLGAPFCVSVVHQPNIYNFDVAAGDLAPFTAPGGLDLSLISTIFLDGSAAGPGLASATVTETGDLAWNGQVTLTYGYTPAPPGPTPTPGGVPEPATWAFLLAGFGFAGARVRARRGVLAA